MFDFLLFLYFFTLHADRLSLNIGSFTIRFNNLIAFALLFLLVIRFRARLFKIDRAVLNALLLIACSILFSLLFSPYKRRCFFFFCWYGFTVLFYFLLPYFLIRHYDSRKVISLYLLSYLFVGIYAFLQLVFSLIGFADPFATQFVWGSIVRPNGFAYEPSFYALYMTPFIVMVNFHFLANREEPFYFFKKLTYPKILGLNFLYFVSTSTSTVIAFMIFCMALPFFPQVRRHLLKYSMAFVICFVLLGLVSPFLLKTFFLKFFYHGLSHASFMIRWAGIETGWKIFLANPWVGVGLGGYPSYLFEAYMRGNTELVSPFMEFAFAEASNPLKLFEPSNVLMEILASLGVIGVFAFLFMVWVFVQKARRAIRIDSVLGCNLLLSVIVMLIVLQFNQSVLRTYVWVHLALSFALLEKVIKKTRG